MSALTLLAELQSYGIRLAADGEWLKYGGPPGAITPEILRKLEAAKPALLALLGEQEPAEPEVPPVDMALAGRWTAGSTRPAWELETVLPSMANASHSPFGQKVADSTPSAQPARARSKA